MEAFVSIELVSWLLKMVGMALGVWQLVHLIAKAKEDFQAHGPKGVVDEIIIGLLILGLIGFICFTESGLATIGGIVDTIIEILLNILTLILDFIENSF